jgi:hypothetical protein
MSKFGWDLPPGCKSSDIPGNRPQDIADEQLLDSVEDALRPITYPTANADKYEQAVANVVALVKMAREEGYAQCKSDADEARSYAALQHVDDKRLDPDYDRQYENERRIQAENTRGEEFAP